MIERSATKSGLFAPLAALVALVVGLAGCECGGQRANATFVMCDHAGTFSLSSPTFKLPTTVSTTTGGTCFESDGTTCGHSGSVLFEASSGDVEGNAIVVTIVAAPAAGPGTYALTDEAAGVFTRATIYWYGENKMVFNADLVARSGALVLTRNDIEHFSGTFTMDLQTPDGQHHLSLTGGTFDTGGCSVRSEEVCLVTHD